MNNAKHFDKFTGKPFDKLSDRLSQLNGLKCDSCNSELIDNCLTCGAPICCPTCCKKTSNDLNTKTQSERAIP